MLVALFQALGLAALSIAVGFPVMNWIITKLEQPAMFTLIVLLFKWFALWCLFSLTVVIGGASWIVWRLSRGKPDDRL